jgi:hypothetical protein
MVSAYMEGQSQYFSEKQPRRKAGDLSSSTQVAPNQTPAMVKMQQLAQMLYDTTPGLEKDVPRQHNRILSHIKKEDKNVEKRANFF